MMNDSRRGGVCSRSFRFRGGGKIRISAATERTKKHHIGVLRLESTGFYTPLERKRSVKNPGS